MLAQSVCGQHSHQSLPLSSRPQRNISDLNATRGARCALVTCGPGGPEAGAVRRGVRAEAEPEAVRRRHVGGGQRRAAEPPDQRRRLVPAVAHLPQNRDKKFPGASSMHCVLLFQQGRIQVALVEACRFALFLRVSANPSSFLPSCSPVQSGL